MIFVTVGTTKFELLVRKIDEIALNIKEDILIQTGTGKYKPKNCKHFEFKKDIKEHIKKADLIITHGGAGTLFELLAIGNKRIIGVNNENLIDEHQSDLLNKLSKEKYLIWCNDLNQIENAIQKSKTFKFKKYNPPKCEIDKIILQGQ